MFGLEEGLLFTGMEKVVATKEAELANPTLHQTPDTLAVLAECVRGAGELNVRHAKSICGKLTPC